MQQLSWLGKTFAFPPCDQALEDPNGLLAVGGDLNPARILSAYQQGIFPWYGEPPILWWSPNPRTLLDPAQVHVSRSLAKFMRKMPYRVTFDQDFKQVLHNCANVQRANQPGTWLNTHMQKAYYELHRQGHAHSVEVWEETQLIGGLYGLSLGQCFFGESMFSLKTNASKVALVTLCNYLNRYNYNFIDCQVETPHLLSMGAKNVSRDQFLQRLQQYRHIETAIDWTFTLDRG